MELVDKVAFVTGGSGDIGRAIAIALAAAGADIVVSYVSSAERASVAAVQAVGRRGLAVHLNHRDPLAIKTAYDKVVAACGVEHWDPAERLGCADGAGLGPGA